MPTGIYDRTKAKANTGWFKKGVKTGVVPAHAFKGGYEPWNKGQSMSDEHKESISKALTGHKPWNKGKTGFFRHTNKWREERSEICKRQVGSMNPAYKHGLSRTQKYRNLAKSNYIRRKRGAVGSHTIIEWDDLKAKYNYMCPCCGLKEPTIKLSEDHIVPLIRGGRNDINNIQPLCLSCNSRKSTKIMYFSQGENNYA